MSLSEHERSTIVAMQFEKAVKNMAQADKMLKLQYFDMTANRLYYACFHAIQALLIANGFSCHTHAGTIAEFGKNFIRTGKIPVEYGRFISRLEQLREKGDYNCAYEVDEYEVDTMIAPAHGFLLVIKERLGF